MVGFVGGPPEQCKNLLFADSDHAGEHENRSTSGCLLALVGPNTFFPLTALSKKQTSTAMSSTEAEVTAANLACVLLDCLPPACGQSSVKRGEIAQHQSRSAGCILVPKTPQKIIGSMFRSPMKLLEPTSNQEASCLT